MDNKFLLNSMEVVTISRSVEKSGSTSSTTEPNKAAILKNN